ncbi:MULTISPECIES: hypothetical protein [Halobacterium]|uniref:hypothetical protein n=1 Tax=Halobacterium TaxID=2239 RepID=UPI001964CF13|nr:MULTISPECIES: hypothetical protein [Halobacterium]MDL0122084.1 hypothetical protein [Halobacterium salinarum]QRY25744.1 hypothetical protein JRZ79_04895 [Halobacterium sp. BOL4-2]
MSDADTDDDGERNRREVAYRLFAAEFDDADFSYAESDEERAPNYVVTPTGARVNRLFVVGVLTAVEAVNDDVVRARVVDPTGAFVVYAGQYQPEALAALEAAETPSFVAVTGKARTFEPDDADVVYTSVRPETVSEVDADTRDRWVVATAERTLSRVRTAAAAHDRVERGDSLESALAAAGVAPGLASGIPRAFDHYGTTPAYLGAVRDLAADAARVVAGDTDTVGGLAVAPSEAGDATLDFAADLGADASFGGASETDAETQPDSSAGDAGTPAGTPDSTASSVDTDDGEPASETASPDGDADPSTGPVTDGESGAADEDGEMYELSAEEREAVKDEYGVDFSTGDEIPEAGEHDIDAPGPDEGVESEAAAASTDDGGDAVADPGDFDADGTGDDSPPADVDVEEYVVELMDDLDDGDGVPRSEVVSTAADSLGVDADEVEAAVTSALMSGRCYESGDDRLKAI